MDRPNYGYHQTPVWWTNEFYWGYLKVYGWGVTTKKQKWLKDSCIFKALPSTGDSSQSWEPKAYCRAHRQLNRLGSTLSRCLSWSKPLPGSLAGFCFFHAAGLGVSFAAFLLWESWQLSMSANFLCSQVLLTLTGRSQWTWWASQSYLPSHLKSSPGGWNILILEELLNNSISLYMHIYIYGLYLGKWNL